MHTTHCACFPSHCYLCIPSDLEYRALSSLACVVCAIQCIRLAIYSLILHQSIYLTDCDKVTYIFQRLSGRAYDQLIPIMSTANSDNEAPELGNLEQALEKLDALFGQVNRVEEAVAKLATLRQKPSE